MEAEHGPALGFLVYTQLLLGGLRVELRSETCANCRTELNGHEQPAGHTQASIPSGTFLSLMEALCLRSVPSVFAGLPRAGVTQPGAELREGGWGHYQRAGLDDGEDAAENP